MVRTTLAFVAAALGVATLAPPPAFAQARDKVLIIYGDDKCPVSNGEEIVICSRKAEAERYRIPEELRDSFKGARPSWAERAQSIEYAGRGGTQSCSPVGPGGASGCYNKIVRQARAENKQDGADTAIKF